VHGHGTVRHQHEDDEHGADRIQHQFDRETPSPRCCCRGFIMRTKDVASRIGNISTPPCMTGTAIVGQRFCMVRRRSLQAQTPSAPHRSRRCRAHGQAHGGIQPWRLPPCRPGDRAEQQSRKLGLRPRNTRAAFQTMPQATKPTAFSASTSGSPSFDPPMSRSPPRRHRADSRAPHFKAGMFSCLRRTQAGPEHARTMVANR